MTLPALALAWLLAFAVCGTWGAPWWMTAAWFAALSPLVLLLRGVGAMRLTLGAAGMAAIGGALFTAAVEETPVSPVPFGERFAAEGVIASEPDPGLRSTRYRVELDAVAADGEQAATDIAVIMTLSQFARFLPGDRVRLEGVLDEPPSDLDGFDYRAFLLSQGVVGTMFFPQVAVLSEGKWWSPARVSTRLRLEIEESLQQSLPEPEASLAAGIAVGRDDSMPPDLAEDYRVSGLSHLTAVSGGNVAILSALVFALTAPFLGRYWAVIPAAALLVLYLVAAGFEESIVRATIMAAVFLVGLWLGRPQSGLAALGAAAIAMTAFDPSVAKDVGFQLSLAATAGLIVLSPWLQAGIDRALGGAGMGGFAGSAAAQALAMTLAATVATLPIIAHTFGRVSIVGFAANILAAPVFAGAFVLSLATAVGEMLFPELGWVAGLAAYYPLALLNWLATTAAAMPGASAETGAVGAGVAVAWFAVYVVAGAYLYLRPAPRLAATIPGKRDRLVWRGFVALAAGGMVAWIGAASIAPLGGPGRLEISLLDVGQGDAILVRAPGGETILVDGGPSGMQAARQLGEALPHWQRDIQLIVLTHPQEDHVAGLPEVLARYEVARVATNGTRNDTIAFEEFERRAGEINVVAAGDVISVGELKITVLWPAAGDIPGDLNEASVVLRIDYGETSALLTGDIESGAQGHIMEAGGFAAQLLKVPHHGSATSDPLFLQATGASAAGISAGAGNRFGHPADVTLRSLEGMEVYRTDVNGRITFRSDGESWTVETAK